MSTLTLTLLGPVSASTPDGPLPVGNGRPLLLLATLLSARGAAVPPERLVDALWEEPPASARANLRTYVARVRRGLGPYAERLAHTAGGHALEVLPGELDLDRFTSALEAVKDSQLRTDPAGAAAQLGAALSAWTGSVAGEGLPRHGAMGRFLDALDEQHLLTVERCAAAHLAAGDHQAAVDRVGPLVRRHETRETAWWLLVRALHESGDRNEALRVWKLASQTLRAELGVDPSPRMRQLLERIKSGPAERSPGRPVERTPARGPDEGGARDVLPPAPDLVGRDELLSRLLSLVPDRHPVLLHGVAGAGKSALALRAAHELAGRFPDGRTYLDLCGSTPGLAPMSPEEIAVSLLRVLGVEQRDGSLGFALAALADHLAGREALVVLDNVRDAGQVRPVLQALSSAGVIMTSRVPLASLEAERLGVGTLDEESAVRLLGDDAAGSGDARRLVNLCGRLPLALRIVQARLSAPGGLAVSSLVERLGDERHVLDELAVDDLEVRASLSLMVEHLADQPDGDDAVRLLTAWGVARVPDLTRPLASALLGPDHGRVRAFDRLAASGLLEPHGPDRFRLHDLVRLYAVELGRALPAGARAEVEHRLRCYLLENGRAARDAIRPDPYRIRDEFTRDVTRDVTGGPDAAPARVGTTEEAMAWFEQERANLVAAARAAHDGAGASASARTFAARLSAAVYPFLPMRGHYRDLREIATLGLRAATSTGDAVDEANNRTYLAAALSRTGAADEAVTELERALALRRQLGAAGPLATTLDHLGYALAAAHRLHEARDVFLEALSLHRANGAGEALGVSLNNLADLLLQLGEVDEALGFLTESLALRVRHEDHVGIAITTLTIAQAHAGAQRSDEALEWLARALDLARSTGNRESEWRALKVRGELHTALGRTDDALADLGTALTLSQGFDDAAAAEEVRLLIDRVG